MRTCPHCLAPAETDAHFCGNCGRLVGDAESQSPTLADEVQSLPYGAINLPPTGDLIGREIIGQYVIRQKLGAGGMGEVYLADQPAIGRAVAIKVLHPHLTRGGDTAKRFQQEAQAAARLQNPHIVQIFNYGLMTDGTSFIAMELLAGRTLGDLIREQAPLEPWRAVKIVRQCCEALDEAHAAGVVHRDLKPANLMLVQRGQDPEFVKVLDFGVAKLDDGEMTRDGAVLGTPQYMSPEQLRSEEIDGRSDLYALGVIAYELLSGKPPFVARNPVGYVNMHLNEVPPAIAARVPTLPPALAQVVMDALEKRREARPQTAAEFSDRLAAAIGLGPAATGSGPAQLGSAPAQSGSGPSQAWSSMDGSQVAITQAETSASTGGAAPFASSPTSPIPPPAVSTGSVIASFAQRRRSPLIWVLPAVIVAGLLAVGGGILVLRSSRQKTEAAERLAALERRVAEQGGTGRGENGAGDKGAGDKGAGDKGAGDKGAGESGAGEPSPTVPEPNPAVPEPTPVTPEPTPSVPEPTPVTPKPTPVTPEPTPVTPDPDPVDPPSPRPQGDLSPETEALMKMGVAELEAKLDKALAASLMPPSTRTQVKEAYELYKRTVPAGTAGDAQLKYTLVQYIKGYDTPQLRAKRGDRLSRAELEKVFMTMEMANELTPELRKTVLTQALSSYENYEPAEDAEFLRKVALAAMIRAMAVDPDIIDKKP